ncbi:MAG: hypothetical protein V4469_02805 [Patescibacteria group bacterium]
MNAIPPVVYYAGLISSIILLFTGIRSTVSKYGRQRMNYALEFAVCISLLAFLYQLVFFGYCAEVTAYGKELFYKWRGREGELVLSIGLAAFIFMCFALTFLVNRLCNALLRTDEWHKVRKQNQDSPWAPP